MSEISMRGVGPTPDRGAGWGVDDNEAEVPPLSPPSEPVVAAAAAPAIGAGSFAESALHKASLHEDTTTPFSFTWQDFYNRNFYISGAWDLEYYHTVRGSENFHIYLWIAKDLAWSQDWPIPAMLFGALAVAWCFVLLRHAIESGIPEELYMWVATVLWLAANFLWMTGEEQFGDDDYVVPRTAIIMESAIAWILFLHVILRPLKLIPAVDYEQTIYSRPGLTCRFSYFKYWRQYEHAHTLCWLGKDLSWNTLNPYFWVLCLIPTVLIASDFIWVTFRTKRMMEDCVHYVAQLLWVVGNMFWAMGNIFITYDDDSDDSAMNMFVMDEAARARLRNWGSWMLFSAYWPLILLYLVWIPMTFWSKSFTERASFVRHREQQVHTNSRPELSGPIMTPSTEIDRTSLFMDQSEVQADIEHSTTTHSPLYER